ncbi:Enoyl-CoA hydratase domain-containing protein 3, mitochondrial [Halotydeus destructor]|nr:Enoyl-CoA hydratase domain-containing protein 3, mitochondrial [Halotydeus destructor]
MNAIRSLATVVLRTTRVHLKGSGHLSTRSVSARLFSTEPEVEEAKPEPEPLTIVQEHDGVRTITLNNTKKRNALSLAMLESLANNLGDNEQLKCIVINAKGPAFSAGHDLSEFTSEQGSSHHKSVFNFCSQVMLTIRNVPVPVIAQVDGVAAAAGCQLAATCDFVIATEQSTFSTPGANVGLFCSTPGIAVSRAANGKMSKYMLFTGIPISAHEAVRSGLITRAVKKEDLEKETKVIVDAICAKSKSVVALGKRFYNEQEDMDLETAYGEGSDVMVENLALVDCQNGINAFLNKTKPTWTNTWDTVKVDKKKSSK